MAKKKKEEVKEVIEEITQETKVNEPTGKETKGDVTKVKEKMTMKPEVVGETITKVDLNVKSEEKEEAKEEIKDDAPVLEEVVEAQEIAIKTEEAITESIETGKALPDNIQKVVDFIEETGGTLNDYVKLNQDYSDMDNQTILQEYYKNTKPHLNSEEIDFLMDDQFSYEEDVDEDRDIKRKKLALKEQVANAKTYLDGQKSKYYEDIKSGSKLTDEQQEAIKSYNESKESAKRGEQITSNFLNKTNKFFGDKFKGFEYSVGDKKYRYNVSDAGKIKENQSDINNFIGKFLDDDYNMVDPSGYHKSLYTAMNADRIANHFYEQGKADAMKNSAAESKNLDMSPRQELNDGFRGDGVKVRALNDDSNDFKFKIKNNKFQK